MGVGRELGDEVQHGAVPLDPQGQPRSVRLAAKGRGQVAGAADRPAGRLAHEVARFQAGGRGDAVFRHLLDAYAAIGLAQADAQPGSLRGRPGVLGGDPENGVRHRGSVLEEKLGAVAPGRPGDEDGSAAQPEVGQLMGDAEAVFRMAASDDGDDQGPAGAGMAGGDGLGHGAIPGELRLDETPEGRIVGGCRAGRRRGPVVAEDAGEGGDVGRAGRSRRAKPFAGVRRNGIPAILADPGHQRPLDVERHHRDAVHAREIEQRHIERRREAPHLVPLRLLEEGAFVDLAGDPAVEDRLQAPGKGLEAQDHVRGPAVQGRQGVQLPAMIFDAGVGFAQHHGGPPGQGVEEGGKGHRPAGGGRQPAAGRRRAGRVRRGVAAGPGAGGAGAQQADEGKQVGSHGAPNMATARRSGKGRRAVVPWLPAVLQGLILTFFCCPNG